MTDHHSRRRTAIYALLLACAVLVCGLLVAVTHRPIPPALSPPDPLVISGQRLLPPVDVGYATGLLDGGSMIFVIKDAAGDKHGIVCRFGVGAERFRRLEFNPSLTLIDGNGDPPLRTINDEDGLLRNFLYHTMEGAGFHGSAVERAMARQLYPSLYERLLP
jgi:hypothetical protein